MQTNDFSRYKWIEQTLAKKNLVILCWSGIRRYMYPESIGDRTFYIRKQVQQLTKLSHNLDQITFVIPHNKLEFDDFTSYIDDLPEQIGTAKVVVHRRPNIGMSYGGFSEVFGKYRNEFDYFLFLEDDYFFVQDHFDLILEAEIKLKKTGFVCMLAGNGGGVYEWHAAVPMGIISTVSGNKVWDHFGELPHSKSPTDYTSNEAGQVAFGNAFVTHGDGLADLHNDYQCSLSMLGKVHYIDCNYKGAYDLIVPTQVLMEKYD